MHPVRVGDPFVCFGITIGAKCCSVKLSAIKHEIDVDRFVAVSISKAVASALRQSAIDH